jgi:regulator of sirC expression with transglutaminase-like and TPR domain
VDAVTRFGELARRRPDEVDLATAALLIGAAGDGEAGEDLSRWLRELDSYADGVHDVDSLRYRLFRQLGFRGNEQNYHDPANSFLQRVMGRRLGIPITLSVLTVEVGRRAGVPLHLVSMPGHFLVGVPDGSALPRHIDAFDGGRVLDLAGCEARYRQVSGAGADVSFGAHLLPRVGAHDVLIRMLANLSVCYSLVNNGRDLEWVARMRLTLPRVTSDEVLALSSALELQGRFLDAARAMEECAEAMGDPDGRLGMVARRLRARNN